MNSSNGRARRSIFRHHLAESLSDKKALCVYLLARSYEDYPKIDKYYGEIAERVNELWEDSEVDMRIVRSLVRHCYNNGLGMMDFVPRYLERYFEGLKQ